MYNRNNVNIGQISAAGGNLTKRTRCNVHPAAYKRGRLYCLFVHKISRRCGQPLSLYTPFSQLQWSANRTIQIRCMQVTIEIERPQTRLLGIVALVGFAVSSLASFCFCLIYQEVIILVTKGCCAHFSLVHWQDACTALYCIVPSLKELSLEGVDYLLYPKY